MTEEHPPRPGDVVMFRPSRRAARWAVGTVIDDRGGMLTVVCAGVRYTVAPERVRARRAVSLDSGAARDDGTDMHDVHEQ